MSKKPLSELEIVLQARERKKKLQRDILFDKLGIETPEQFKERAEREREAEYAAIPLETKQKFLDLMNSGMKLGEARQAVGIDIMMAAMIIMKNTVELFPTKVIK